MCDDGGVDVGGRVSIDAGADGWAVAGELDASTAPRLRAAFSELPTRTDPVRLDLGAVTFIDSSGLRELIALSERVGAGGGTVVVSAESAAVRRLLEITGLESAFGLDTGKPPAAS